MPNAHLSTEAHPKTGGARALRGHLWYHLPLCAVLLAGCAPQPERSRLPSAEHLTKDYPHVYRHEDATKGVVCYMVGGEGISCVRTSPAPVVEDTTGGRR